MLNLDTAIDESWERDKKLQARSEKEIYRLGFLRGRNYGQDEAISNQVNAEQPAVKEEIWNG